MRTSLRTLLVVLGLLASLREAGSAACASTCVGRPLDWSAPAAASATATAWACAPAACCSPCGEPAVPCPLLEPTPQALVERAPVARALPEPAAFAAFTALLPAQVFTLNAGPLQTASAGPADRGIRPRAGPLWLRDLRLLL